MAADIIPIELKLTDGNGITLWAPQWEEDGEEWEAFLGHGDHLYVFGDCAHLAAFIRSTDEHDLADHPQWEIARRLLTDELEPDEDHQFDIVGIPDLVAERPDVWSLAELADTVAILHSLAEVCDIEIIDEILGSAAGFGLAAQGPTAFIGRAGGKLWHEVGSVVAKRWDEVIEALDALVTTPEVDADAVAQAQGELDAVTSAEEHAASTAEGREQGIDEYDEDSGDRPAENGGTDERDSDLEFWDEVGIDCIQITVDGRTGWTLRCYLDDEAVFLAESGKTQMFPSPSALEEYLADPTAENTLSHLDAWTTIREGIAGGEASVIAGPENTYRMDGLADQLLEGPDGADADQVELAVELLTDAADSRDDTEVATAFSSASPLGNLIRAITQPDPDRLPPSPPFDDEATAWSALVNTFAASLAWR